MKKYFLFTISLLITLYSCKNEDILTIPESINTQCAQDHLKVEQIFNHINKITEDILLENDQHKSCVKYSFDTININNNPTPVIIANFDQSEIGCIFFETKIMTGEIIIAYTNNYTDSLSTTYISFNNYKVNNELIQGDVIITNQGRNDDGNICFIIEVNNATINTSNGTINWETNRKKEWISGAETKFERSDDVYEISGSSNGNSVNGTDFSVEINDVLIMDLECTKCIIKNGVSSIIAENYPTQSIHYGENDCNCAANISLNDMDYSILIGN